MPHLIENSYLGDIEGCISIEFGIRRVASVEVPMVLALIMVFKRRIVSKVLAFVAPLLIPYDGELFGNNVLLH